jgi:hypothetical protein
MSNDGSYRDILYGGDPHGRDHDGDDETAKPCTFVGCGGTMRSSVL